MVDYKEIIKSIEGLDYEQLVILTQEALGRLRPILRLIDIQNRGLLLFLNIICTAIGADGELTPLEKQFVCEAFSVEEETLEELIKFPGNEEIVDKLADAISDDVKRDIVIVVCAISACDKTISRDELSFLEKIVR